MIAFFLCEQYTQSILAEAKCKDLPREAVSKANTYCTDSEFFLERKKTTGI